MSLSAPRLCLDTAMAQGLRLLFQRLEQRLEPEQPIPVYLAGGIAVHLYTGTRVTTDVDAEFAARIFLPGDLAVELTLPDGTEQVLYLDTNFNTSFALMHEAYRENAITLDLGCRQLRTFVLSPLDLALSKIARFSANDQEDLFALARFELICAEDVKRLAEEALGGYVGNTAMVRMNLRDALALIQDAASLEHPGAG